MTKKHELLKFAYDNYPEGTKFIGAYGKEFISNGEFNFPEDLNINEINICNVPSGSVYHDGKWAEIVKPKIAVKVENEKEFKAIEKHLGKKPFFTEPFEKVSYPVFIYLDGGKYPCQEFVSLDCEEIYLKGYQTIPFSQFSAEHNIKLPLLTSEDGVDLYEGDEFTLAVGFNNKYFRYGRFKLGEYKEPESDIIIKKFHDDAKALDWIEAQKPKEIQYVSEFGIKCQITKEETLLNCSCGCFSITKKDIEEINKALKEIEK